MILTFALTIGGSRCVEPAGLVNRQFSPLFTHTHFASSAKPNWHQSNRMSNPVLNHCWCMRRMLNRKGSSKGGIFFNFLREWAREAEQEREKWDLEEEGHSFLCKHKKVEEEIQQGREREGHIGQESEWHLKQRGNKSWVWELRSQLEEDLWGYSPALFTLDQNQPANGWGE